MEGMFEDLPNEELFTAEDELKKKITKLERELKKHDDINLKALRAQAKLGEKALLNSISFYESEIETLREQIRELFEKNLELHETSKIFVKGLEHLKKDGITISETIIWERKGVHGTIEVVIARLAMNGRKIVAMCPMQVTHQGETIKAVIVTEHIDRTKNPR